VVKLNLVLFLLLSAQSKNKIRFRVGILRLLRRLLNRPQAVTCRSKTMDFVQLNKAGRSSKRA
jgi:hypothetical protein